MTIRSAGATAALLGVIAGLSWALSYTQRELDARFYYDLGPEEIDVTHYPKKQQWNYKIFRESCGQCHSLARAVNSPLALRKEWAPFVDKMHARAKNRPGTILTRSAANRILDFLAYDSMIRKVENRPGFEANSEQLKELFDKIQADKSRMAPRSISPDKPGGQ